MKCFSLYFLTFNFDYFAKSVEIISNPTKSSISIEPIFTYNTLFLHKRKQTTAIVNIILLKEKHWQQKNPSNLTNIHFKHTRKGSVHFPLNENVDKYLSRNGETDSDGNHFSIRLDFQHKAFLHYAACLSLIFLLHLKRGELELKWNQVMNKNHCSFFSPGKI